jgi:hypothetical protein
MSGVGAIVDLVPDRLYGLVHPYELDGRVTSHPRHARGWTSMNCYLLTEPDRVLLWSTGFSFHQSALLEQLDALVQDRPLAIVVPRVEFASMCNARPIADRFAVDAIHQQIHLESELHLNFRPRVACGPGNGLAGVRQTGLNVRERIVVDRAGQRQLRLVDAPLRLLPVDWGYDPETCTLFTSDMFSWCVRDSEAGPWTDSGSAVDADGILDTLSHSRYWWLPGANVEPVRRALDALFSDLRVDIIAPDHGPIIQGTAVEAHVALLDDALVTASTLEPIGLDVGRWSLEDVA